MRKVRMACSITSVLGLLLIGDVVIRMVTKSDMDGGCTIVVGLF